MNIQQITNIMQWPPSIHTVYNPVVFVFRNKRFANKSYELRISTEYGYKILFVDFDSNGNATIDISATLKSLFANIGNKVESVTCNASQSFRYWLNMKGLRPSVSFVATRSVAQLGEAHGYSNKVSTLLTAFKQLPVYTGYPRDVSMIAVEGTVNVGGEKIDVTPNLINRIKISCADKHTPLIENIEAQWSDYICQKQGNAERYIPISTPEEFLQINTIANPDNLPYVLTNNLDFENATISGNIAWAGSLYGQGYSIKNITLSSPLFLSFTNDKINLYDICFVNISSNYPLIATFDENYHVISNCRFINIQGTSVGGFIQTTVNADMLVFDGCGIASALGTNANSKANNLSVRNSDNSTLLSGGSSGSDFKNIISVNSKGSIGGSIIKKSVVINNHLSDSTKFIFNSSVDNSDVYSTENCVIDYREKLSDNRDGVTISTEQAQSQSFYESIGFDFDGSTQPDGQAVWAMGDDGYPVIVRPFKQFKSAENTGQAMAHTLTVAKTRNGYMFEGYPHVYNLLDAFTDVNGILYSNITPEQFALLSNNEINQRVIALYSNVSAAEFKKNDKVENYLENQQSVTNVSQCPLPENPLVTINNKDSYVLAFGGCDTNSASVSVNSSSPWNINAAAVPSWVSISPLNGNTGQTLISVSTLAATMQSQTVNIPVTLNNGKARAMLTVSQYACVMPELALTFVLAEGVSEAEVLIHETSEVVTIGASLGNTVTIKLPADNLPVNYTLTYRKWVDMSGIDQVDGNMKVTYTSNNVSYSSYWGNSTTITLNARETYPAARIELFSSEEGNP